MKKAYLILFFLGLVGSAQTGIGTTTPNVSAKLDVYSTNKGFLPPRVTLTSATDATTIVSAAEGLLVYNLGSVGLQAGYYYWNGASWATIATATSAGNGVTSSNLVKLYGEAYSTASGKIAETNGFSFTVPVSGRYLFDFTSSGYANNATFTMTFKVRQGTTDIGTDTQTSSNNTVHVEYNGKVEVNLQIGTTYNIIVTSTGIRNIADYDRVYYKMVAGNLPVTGQSVDYGIARYTGSDTGAMSASALIVFDASAPGNLAWSGNKFTLKANKTYELESSLAIYQGGGGVAGRFQIYDYTNSVALASGLFMSQNGAGTNNPSANSPMKGIVTPSTDIQVGIRLLDYYGIGGPGIIGSTSFTGNQSSPNTSYFMVKQIGSSAIVNPWILSGNNVYNTTGNVGLGTTTPSTSLHIQNGNSAGVGSPASTLAPSIYVLNSNNASSTANSTVSVQTAGTGSGKPFYSLDVSGAFGYSMGINNPTDQMIINTSWDFKTTATNNAIIINRTGQTRVGIPSSAGSITDSWPSGWGGGLATYDFSCAGIYYQTLAARSDRRLKNNIVDLDSTIIANYLQLRPVNYYWNDGADNHHKQYGLIAQEVEPLFPDMVSTANDAMQTKSINYQALHAISLKVIQSQQAEIDNLKKNQVAIETRLLQLETKLK